MKIYNVDKLRVKIMATRREMGKVAADDISAKIIELQSEQDEINIIFAAAPSQNEVLANLTENGAIDWTKINAFHMDEYIGLSQDAPQRFGNFLKNAVFGKVPFKSANYINGSAEDIDAECKRYAKLLSEHPIDIVCMGVGENGHIAFNDPPVADFNDAEVIKRVELDAICRNQQVNDGCFKTIDEVPTHALTLTCPTLFGGKNLFCVVPAATKADAINAMLKNEISTACPASILRKHDAAVLYCDKDSAGKL